MSKVQIPGVGSLEDAWDGGYRRGYEDGRLDGARAEREHLLLMAGLTQDEIEGYETAIAQDIPLANDAFTRILNALARAGAEIEQLKGGATVTTTAPLPEAPVHPYRLIALRGHRVTVRRAGADDLDTWQVWLSLHGGYNVLGAGRQAHHITPAGRCDCGERECVHLFCCLVYRRANAE